VEVVAFNSTRCIRNNKAQALGWVYNPLSTPHGALGTEREMEFLVML